MSDEMIPTSPSQWDHQIPYYHHHQTSSEFTVPFQPGTVTGSRIEQALLRDDQTMLPPNTTSGQTIPTPEIVSSSSSCVGELMSPKNGVAKPARRRPRASKKAPTTLLNASLTNFRSLVQQYTGCHSSSSHSSILRNQRGPITLSFGPPPASNDFQTSGEQAWHHEQEQQQPQGQQLMVSYNNNSFLDSSPNYSGVDKNNSSSSKSSNPSSSMLTVDDYDEWQ